MSDIRDFKNWTEVSRGYYRYVVGANACYEIIAVQEGAKTGPDYYSLYVTGVWRDPTETQFFKRECLASCEYLDKCLEFAEKDFEQNDYLSKEDIEENLETLKYLAHAKKDDRDVNFKEIRSIARVVLKLYDKVCMLEEENK